MTPNAVVLTAFAVTAVAAAAREEGRPPGGCPRDGRPLGDYEKHKLASVLIGFMAGPDDDRSDERENRL